MTASAYLAWRSLRHRWGRALLIALALGVVLAVPLAARVLVDRFEDRLGQRADAVPLVMGAKGSRFELVLSALYHRGAPEGDLPMSVYDDLLAERVEAIPLRLVSTARDRPVVGTSIELLEHRGLYVADGRHFAMPGECLLGARAAAELGLGPGDTIGTDLARGYDLTTAPSIELRVAGVLAQTGSPDDDAVFVDLETCWIIEGFAHGHDDTADIEAEFDEDAVLARTDDVVVLAPGVQTRQAIAADDLDSFHLHGDRADLPLSAILVFPGDERATTILASRVNATPYASAVRPGLVIGVMLEHVVRVRRVLDAAAAVAGAATLVLSGLIGALAIQLRRDELAMLDNIGAPRTLVTWMLGFELLGQLALAIGVAALITVAVRIAGDTIADTMLALLG